MILLYDLLGLLQAIVLIRVFLTWIMPGKLPYPLNVVAIPIDKFLQKFKVLIPVGNAYLDLGPMLLLVLIHLTQSIIANLA